MASFNNCSAISSQTFNLTHSSFLHFCHPGADGAGVLRALAQAGVWNVFAPVQPTGWRPPALPLRLLLCWEAMQPGPGSLLLQLALQLPPPARLTGPHGVLPALRPQEFEFSVALFLRDELLHPSVLWCDFPDTAFKRCVVEHILTIAWLQLSLHTTAHEACGACRQLWRSSHF